MCLNEIFKNEQIFLMRYAQATGLDEITSCENALSDLELAFQPFPYPHRPFAWRGRFRGPPRANAIPHAPASPGTTTNMGAC